MIVHVTNEKMNRMKQVFLLISLILILGGCASKRYVKKALELENSGLYSDAANNYYNSLTKNINNIDAKLGLQRTGQLVLEDYIEKFKSQYQNGTPKDAVYAFINADNYNNKLKKVGINLIFPEEQRSYYQEVEDTYLNTLYQEASKALDVEEFASSERMFAEILSLNNNYKDAKSKWIIAKYEPVYREGKEMMGSQMYRSAYFVFKNIIDKVKVYENSIDLMNQSLDSAKITIAISSIKANYTSYQTLADQLKSKLINGINEIESPLYEVVTGSVKNFESDPFIKKAYEYDRTKKPVKSGVVLNSKAIIEGAVQNFKVYNGKLIKREKRGYLKRTETYVDKETQEKKTRTIYDKVKYYEYQMERKVLLTFQYAMKRTDRNEIAISDVFNQEESDGVHYIQFDGDYKKLVPGYWKYMSKDSSEDYINDKEESVNALRKLYSSKKTAKSIHDLQQDLMNKCIGAIVAQIENYKPEN